MVMSSPPNKSGSAKKTRAKHACRECNSRRVRCDVTEVQPCSNCATSGSNCEVLPSRRGRYPRRNRKQSKQSTSSQSQHKPSRSSLSPRTILAAETLSNGIGNAFSPSKPVLCSALPDLHSHMSTDESPMGNTSTRSGAHEETPAAGPGAGTLFFGESNFLTLMPGFGTPVAEAPGADGGKPLRLHFPVPNTPESSDGSGISVATMQYLRDEGALEVPDIQSCLPCLQAYFAWFHPCYPVLDRMRVIEQLTSMSISRLLLQSMLFIGATYCDDATITAMGFQDRSEAKSTLYTKARLLFHADWEKDKTTLIQSLFLMSFWRGGPSDVRDVRYWLGVVITLAETYGLHRIPRTATKDLYALKMRRRIWWSIYVRERQAAASLGLPSRIRDDDCDIEPLSPSDLESEASNMGSSVFGIAQPEQITYAIKMVEIARLLGRIIDLYFSPGSKGPTAEQVMELESSLESWKQSLPENMKYTPDEGINSVWTGLIHLAYNHLCILIHRDSFLRLGEGFKNDHVVTRAACRVSRIAEDMSTHGILRYGQMHMITSLFAALCIHVIGIRRGAGVTRRIAEHRAQMCLLCLKEVQKYWRINNNVLDLFLQYLDRSIAERLHGTQTGNSLKGTSTPVLTGSEAITDAPGVFTPMSSQKDFGKDGGILTEPEKMFSSDSMFEEQYFSLINGHWGGDDALGDLGMFLQGDDLVPNGMNFLGKPV